MAARLPVYSYRELAGILDAGGAVFVRNGGRNHKIWVHKVRGEFREFPIPAHNDGDEIPRHYVGALRVLWELTEEHGVSNENFRRGRWDKK